MSTKDNVSAAKPKITGAVWVAPKGTTLPTDATTALGNEFAELGYVSDAGIVNENTPTITTIKAWGGDDVLDVSEERPDTFRQTLIEVLNPEVAKLVYGDENVSGTLATGITIAAGNVDPVEHVFVYEMIMRNGALKRIVLPEACVTAVGAITYAHNAAVGYETTLTCHPDSEGHTHYEYIKAKSNG